MPTCVILLIACRCGGRSSLSRHQASRFLIKGPKKNGFHSETRVLSTMREQCCTPIFSSFLTRSRSCLPLSFRLSFCMQCVWPAKTERRSLLRWHTNNRRHRSAFNELTTAFFSNYIHKAGPEGWNCSDGFDLLQQNSAISSACFQLRSIVSFHRFVYQ
jgi:hypothetical protein